MSRGRILPLWSTRGGVTGRRRVKKCRYFTRRKRFLNQTPHPVIDIPGISIPSVMDYLSGVSENAIANTIGHDPFKWESPSQGVLVYVAGALNADAVGYIKNLYRMNIQADEIAQRGFGVYVPGNDFLLGLITGSYDYKNYFNNSQILLTRSDAVYLTPGWENSEGTKREIALAKEKDIPVFSNLTMLCSHFNHRLEKE